MLLNNVAEDVPKEPAAPGVECKGGKASFLFP